MSTRLSITVGIFPPASSSVSSGVTPKFTTRIITFTDISEAFNTFSTMLVTPPISNYIPEPEPIVEEPVV